MHPVQSNEADYLLYARSADRYDRVRFSGIAGRWGHCRQVEILAEICGDWREKRVLEIGCGTGRMTEALVQFGAKVTATDISAKMLEVAKSRFVGQEASRTPSFRIMSVSDIDMDLQPFDYIIMVNVFGRLSNPAGAIQAIASRMSANGSLVFTFPCLTSVLFPFGVLVNARGRSLSRDVTSRWYAPKTIAEMCHRTNLEIVKFRGNHFVPIPRLLFWTLPFFWVCDKLLAASCPTRCPSVFAECKISPLAAR